MIIGAVSCLYVDGKHVFGSPDCPHERSVDEMGEVKAQGWTAQHLQ